MQIAPTNSKAIEAANACMQNISTQKTQRVGFPCLQQYGQRFQGIID